MYSKLKSKTIWSARVCHRSEFPHWLRKRTRLWLVLWAWGSGQLRMAKRWGTVAPGGDEPQARESPTPLPTHCQDTESLCQLTKQGSGVWTSWRALCPPELSARHYPHLTLALVSTDTQLEVHQPWQGITAWDCECERGRVQLNCTDMPPSPPPNIHVWALSQVLWLM